jgi:hypothetical protein
MAIKTVLSPWNGRGLTEVAKGNLVLTSLLAGARGFFPHFEIDYVRVSY